MWTVYLANNQVISEKDCNWKDLPNYPIIKLEWKIPNGRTLVMQGFESYLCMHEDYHLFYGLIKNKIVKDTINLLGKKNNQVFQFSYSCRTGKAFQCKNEWNKEFRPLKLSPLPRINKKEPKRFFIDFGSSSKTNHALWHEGLSLPTASSQII